MRCDGFDAGDAKFGDVVETPNVEGEDAELAVVRRGGKGGLGCVGGSNLPRLDG